MYYYGYMVDQIELHDMFDIFWKTYFGRAGNCHKGPSNVQSIKLILQYFLIYAGYGIYIFHGKPGGALSNNELTTFLENPKKNFYFRLHCHSDSVMENVGKLIGLENMTVFNSSFFTITNAQPGELEVVNKDGFNQTPLPDLEQGIYTCCIPLQNQKIKEINIGIYASGFKSKMPLLNCMTCNNSY